MSPLLFVVAEPSLEGSDDVLRDEADANAIGVDGGEDFSLESGLLEVLEQILPKLALDGRGEEDEVGAFRVGHDLKMAVIDGDDGTASEDDDEKDCAGIIVQAAAAEVLEPATIMPVKAAPLRGGIGNRVRLGN
ncbi:hypothetical protein J5N97_005604 [Dioscorea zingiberensis]|uniref:Uncharacterized protein n=1 Tax=Dioscorea zingiberensis TaxID=325984 RepID=A0A9D5DAK0_9LILI|nr:hypothetical protein J5N97_005604 [Dioscorea zingiberensis]